MSYQRRDLLKATAGLAGAGALAGCSNGGGSSGSSGGSSGGGSSEQTTKAEAVKFLIQSGAPGTSYYTISAPLGDILRQYSTSPKLAPTVSTTGGGVQNMRALGQQNAEVAIAVAGAVYNAFHGSGSFEQKWPIRAIARADAYPLFYVVRADSDINSVGDLQGKVVSAGPQGSGNLATNQAIMNLLGIDITRKYLKHGQGGKALRDGKIDAWFIFLGSQVRKTFATANVRPLGFSDDQMSTILGEFPWYANLSLDSDWIEQIQGEYSTIGTGSLWCTYDEFRTDVVREMCEVMYDNPESIESVRNNPSDFTPEFGYWKTDAFDINYHPGATQYYTDAGVK